MLLSALLLAAAPAQPQQLPTLRSGADPRSPAIVQTLLDGIAPTLSKPSDKPVDGVAIKARQQRLDAQLAQVENASILDNVTVSIRDESCFAGECVKLNYGDPNDRKELLRKVDKAFAFLGLYGDSFGWGNYPRPDIAGKKTSASLDDVIWLNWSACQGRGDPYNRMWCTTDYNRLFNGPGFSMPDPPFYAMFRIEGGRVSNVKIVFDRQNIFDSF